MNEEELINACGNDILEEIKSIIEKGGDINAKSNCGWTPLMWASVNGHLDVVKYLIIEGKANSNIRNNEGKTALDLAEENGCKKVAEFLKKCLCQTW